jgi:hypothetical protein
VSVDGGDHLIVNGDRIKVFAERDPSKLPWGDAGRRRGARVHRSVHQQGQGGAHLAGGAKKVIISAPGGSDVDAHCRLWRQPRVAQGRRTRWSPMRQLHHQLPGAAGQGAARGIGIEHGLMTTIHAYTNDQVLTDVYHSDLRRARSATMSQIPTKTGAAAAVGLVLPELNGKLDGFAMRVPTINVSVVDLSFVAKRATSKDEIDKLVKRPRRRSAEGHPRHQHQAAGVGRLQPRSALVGLRRDADQSHGRHAGQGVVLVRQRVGLLEPHAGHDPRADGSQVRRIVRNANQGPLLRPLAFLRSVVQSLPLGKPPFWRRSS